ncbi:hypothetical protein ACHAWF_018535 [Thalassiosira exigua]
MPSPGRLDDCWRSLPASAAWAALWASRVRSSSANGERFVVGWSLGGLWIPSRSSSVSSSAEDTTEISSSPLPLEATLPLCDSVCVVTLLSAKVLVVNDPTGCDAPIVDRCWCRSVARDFTLQAGLVVGALVAFDLARSCAFSVQVYVRCWI